MPSAPVTAVCGHKGVNMGVDTGLSKHLKNRNSGRQTAETLPTQHPSAVLTAPQLCLVLPPLHHTVIMVMGHQAKESEWRGAGGA